MSRRITRLSLRNFRNFESLDLDLHPSLTVLVAPNATGKTNIIEAIQLTTAAESFRKPNWVDVVAWGADFADVRLFSHGNDSEVEIRLTVTGGQRGYQVNGKQKRKIADIRGVVPSVLFTPDDLSLVKGSAERRRDTLDSLGFQITKSYESIRLDYEKVLRHRNALLKNQSMPLDLLDPWTEKLIEIGAAFYRHRNRLFDRLASQIALMYSRLTDNESLTMEHVPSWGQTDLEPVDAFRAVLDTSLLQERARGTTIYGPQRDEIKFFLDGKDARSFASQGQQRSISLAWKLAEIEVMKDILGVNPVLMLDDVMSELDAKRRFALTEIVSADVQTVITTTNVGYFDSSLLDRALVVEL